VLGKPSPAYFGAALEALDADPGGAWIVGDDLESDVAGGHHAGMRTVLVRTGKFREDELQRAHVAPDVVLESLVDLPAFLDQVEKG
jgi:ribonucleotide monophosphatase NagD (HAD superfamily)